MPTPPYAQVTASVNGGAYASGGITAPSAATLDLAMASTVAVTSQVWEVYSYPDGWTAPSGWVLSGAAGSSYTNGDIVPPRITFPANTGALWGDWMLRLTINGGASVDEATAITMLSDLGVTDVGYNETNQFSILKGWVGAIQKSLRVINASLRSATGGITSLTGDVVASGTGAVTAVVAAIRGNGVTAGTPTAGNSYYWSGTSFVARALNLAGTSGELGGVLPIANQASQALAGDATGTTAASIVGKLSGVAGVLNVKTPAEIDFLGGKTVHQTVTTTGATPDSTMVVAIPSDTAGLVSVIVTAKIGSSANSAGQVWSGWVVNNGGTLAVMTTGGAFALQGTAGFTGTLSAAVVSVAVSSTNIAATVTGIAATTIVWDTLWQYVSTP